MKQAEKAFREEINRRKLAKEKLKRETEGYGKYISSNESVSCLQKKEEETGNETDSKEEAAIREQETKAFLEQVQKALVENETIGPLQ